MSEKGIKKLTIILLTFVSITFIYFLTITAFNGYWIWDNQLDFAVTGQFGDFVGGFLGTVINGAAFYFLYLTLNEQRKSSQKQSFETKLYELIHLHRENISELQYTKFYKSKAETFQTRRVFRIVIEEFLICHQEVKRFAKMYSELEIIKPAYELKLEQIRKNNSTRASAKDLAFIDIAFCFFYFGVSKEIETILLHKFYNRYEKEFMLRLKFFLQLKPKEGNPDSYSKWIDFKSKNIEQMKKSFEEAYSFHRKSTNTITEENLNLYYNIKVEKYYGGHQHRFGHYFRHLFQSFKFLSLQSFLTSDEKYFYAKTIRAQFSTYEQFLLFFNSLSSLGMKWEYTVDYGNSSSEIDIADFKFISRYNLIKNLPGSQYYDFTYRRYYPKVDFEYKDDITYVKNNEIIPNIKNKTFNSFLPVWWYTENK